MPCELSRPAGRITVAVEALTLLTMVTGFQLISPIFLIACARELGVVMKMITSGFGRLQA